MIDRLAVALADWWRLASARHFLRIPGFSISINRTSRMWRVASKIRRCLASEDGPTAAEYSVMVGFIIMVLIGVITALGHGVNVHFSSVSSALS